MTAVNWRHPHAAVHLLFAALFGLALPFICWGAQATPGHPHARAHFVFLPPELVPGAGDHGAMPGMAGPAAGSSHDAHQLPPGQSTQSVLATFMLIFVAGAVFRAPANDKPGFGDRLSPPLARQVAPRPAIPPPRPHTVTAATTQSSRGEGYIIPFLQHLGSYRL